jgi:WD40 repeat protein
MRRASLAIVLIDFIVLGFAAGAEPSPLDGVDRAKVANRLKPPSDVPAETLVQLGLRDGRWDTIAARADGKALAVSEPDGKIALFGLPGFQSTASVTHREVVALGFSPDGKILAAGDAKGNLRLWSCNAKTPSPRATLVGVHTGPLWALAYAPDGKRLASAGADGIIKLWDLGAAKPTLKATVHAHDKVIRQLAFAPDGALLASAGSSDKKAKLWTITGNDVREKAVLTCDGPVASVSFAPDGNALATASFDGKVRIWNIGGGTPEAELTMEMPFKSVRLVQFAPDGKALAALLLDERGEHIAVRGRDGTKRYDWNFPHHIQGMTFIDARHLATANEDSVYILRLSQKP